MLEKIRLTTQKSFQYLGDASQAINSEKKKRYTMAKSILTMKIAVILFSVVWMVCATVATEESSKLIPLNFVQYYF